MFTPHAVKSTASKVLTTNNSNHKNCTADNNKRDDFQANNKKTSGKDIFLGVPSNLSSFSGITPVPGQWIFDSKAHWPSLESTWTPIRPPTPYLPELQKLKHALYISENIHLEVDGVGGYPGTQHHTIYHIVYLTLYCRHR